MQIRTALIRLRNRLGLSRISSFESVVLRETGMRHCIEYVILMKNGEAEISKYVSFFSEDGDGRERVPEKRVTCGEKEMLKLLNGCSVLSWDGFYGERPRWIKDGKTFTLNATVNGGTKICAHGAQNFPIGYSRFTQALRNRLYRRN